PFNDPKKSDIILRTSDNVNFYVYRVILSVASPFFESMFSLPQSILDDVNHPVIDVSEDSKILDPLLRLCYPVDDPIISDPTFLGDVLEAALKYETTEAVAVLKSHLRTYTKQNPLQVYSVACRLGLEDIASLAAHELVDWGKIIVGSSYVHSMSKISAGAFYRLTNFARSGSLPPKASFCEKKGHTGTGLFIQYPRLVSVFVQILRFRHHHIVV
ncbi:hypothetical protein BDQ17DRAFT_1254298, partial [Cyathus striatus]